MKKRILLIFLVLLTINLLSACSNEVTGVRLVSVSYEDQNSNVFFSRYNTVSLSTNHSRLNSSENYIFPGDVLKFTIELEDPNFEFVSLLSIQFNNVAIRANVGDSIIKTRDCGLNICIDFPFTVLKDTTNYSVEDIRFVKVNTEGSTSAIIDNQSLNSVQIDVYQSDVYPYVESSIEVLNQFLRGLSFYSDEDLLNILNGDAYSDIMLNLIKGRLIRIYEPSFDVLGDANNINGVATNRWWYTSFMDDYLPINSGMSSYQQISLFAGTDFELIHLIVEDEIDFQEYFSSSFDYFHFYFGILDERYNEIIAYNIGNDIYISFDGDEILFYQMGRLTRFELYENEDLEVGFNRFY